MKKECLYEIQVMETDLYALTNVIRDACESNGYTTIYTALDYITKMHVKIINMLDDLN